MEPVRTRERRGEYRRSRWEGLRGERKEDYILECAEGNFEGAKQTQVKESGRIYRKERVGCGVDDGGKGGGGRHNLVERMLGGMKTWRMFELG